MLKQPKFSVPFVWTSSASLEWKRTIYRYFVNGTTQPYSCFLFEKKKYYYYHLSENFDRKFRKNDKPFISTSTDVPFLPEIFHWNDMNLLGGGA